LGNSVLSFILHGLNVFALTTSPALAFLVLKLEAIFAPGTGPDGSVAATVPAGVVELAWLKIGFAANATVAIAEAVRSHRLNLPCMSPMEILHST